MLQSLCQTVARGAGAHRPLAGRAPEGGGGVRCAFQGARPSRIRPAACAARRHKTRLTLQGGGTSQRLDGRSRLHSVDEAARRRIRRAAVEPALFPFAGDCAKKLAQIAIIDFFSASRS